MRSRASRLTITSGLGVLALLLAGCNRVVNIREEVVPAKEGMVIPGPFAPTEIRIHPLTHVESIGGENRVVLHVEVRDGWGDTIKGIGSVKVHLRRSGASGLGENRVQWDIDLRDFKTNISYFDSVTRTYRFVLSGLPGWFVSDGRGRLRVLFRTARADGEIEVLQDDFEILDISAENE